MYQSTKRSPCPYKTSAERSSANKAASIRSSGKATIGERPSINQVADAQRNQNAQLQGRFEQNDSVYDRNERDGSGRVTGKRYWICCMQWNKSKTKMMYKLKDGPYPHGKTVRWVVEGSLEEWYG